MRWRILAATHGMLVLAVACGGDATKTGSTPDKLHTVAESFCKANADCVGADSAWIEGCVTEADREIAAAEGHSCLDIMATWLNCLDEKSSCTTDDDPDPTDKYYTDQGACNDEEELAEDCRKGRL